MIKRTTFALLLATLVLLWERHRRLLTQAAVWREKAERLDRMNARSAQVVLEMQAERETEKQQYTTEQLITREMRKAEKRARDMALLEEDKGITGDEA